MDETSGDPLESMSRAELIAEIRRLRQASAVGMTPVTDEPGLLRAAIEAAPVAITVKAADGRYVYANPLARRSFGPPSGDLLGHTAFDVMPPATAAAVAANDRTVLTTGEAIPFYEATLFAAGEERLMRTTKVPLRTVDGGTGWVLTVSLDVTEQRENEARLRALAERAPFPVYFKDRDARFTIVNERMLKLYGISAEQALGRTSRELFADGVGHEYTSEDEHVLETRKVFEREIELGGQSHIAVKFPVIDSNGRLLGLGGIEPDVTRLKKMQQALALAKETAELANRSKTEFLANMSHELRTPLNSIIGFAELIRRRDVPYATAERAREYAADIARSGEHLLKLIDDLLDVSRIEIGAVQIEETEFDIATVIDDGLRMFAVRASDCLSVRASLHADEVMVRGDERRLRQVLINLLSNAVKFTPRGEVHVETAAAGHGGVVIRVRDTGVGIPASEIERALAPFARSGSAQIRNDEGVGLGLWLAKEITELHGGRLSLQSREGVGTTVSVVLPPDRVLRRGAVAAPV